MQIKKAIFHQIQFGEHIHHTELTTDYMCLVASNVGPQSPHVATLKSLLIASPGIASSGGPGLEF